MRALVYGFHYSDESVRNTISGLRAAGFDEIRWLVHPGRAAKVARLLDGTGIRTYEPNVASLSAPVSAGGPLLSDATHLDLRFLVDRDIRSSNEWERSLLIENLRSQVFRVLIDFRPDRIFFSEVPHLAVSYLAYRLASALGIPAHVIRYGPTPFHVSLVRDIDARLLDEIESASPAAGLAEASDRYIARLREPYTEAAPAYVAGTASIGSRANQKLRAGARSVSPKLAGALLERIRLKRQYESLALDPAFIRHTEGPPPWTVFLHLQPERTTTPEGGRFAQQWLVVERLRSVLDERVPLLVREHPATFVRGTMLVRSVKFYEALIALGNVHLVSTSVSPFDLIDASEGVASVGGTVTFESAVRGVPAVVFGNAVYRGCENVVDATRLLNAERHTPLDVLASSGVRVEEFLSRFDSSSNTWCAAWNPGINVHDIRREGRAFRALLSGSVSA